MNTISKLKLLGIPDNILSKVTNFSTTDLINDHIVGSLMAAIIKSDVQALRFCDVMSNLVDSASSKTHIEILRNGR